MTTKNLFSRLTRLTVAAATLCVFIPAIAGAQAVNMSPLGSPFNNPIGIDFHETTGKLILSANYPSGTPNNLDVVDPNLGTSAPFGTLSGLREELKIATVRTSAACQGFPVGDVFTANGEPGEIVRVNKTGAVYGPAPNNGVGFTGPNGWVKLPGETEILRGSLFVDRACAFNGDLIVVTGNDSATGGGSVWRVQANGIATKLNLGNTITVGGVAVHLEGLITLPNDAKYGPWAGKILAGEENFNIDGTKHGRLWSIPPVGAAVFYDLSYTDATTGIIHPVKTEDLDILLQGEDFFGVNFGDQRVLRIPTADLAAYENAGDILLTQEYPCNGGSPSVTQFCPGSNGSSPRTTGLYAVRYVGTGGNAAGGLFNVVELKFAASSSVKQIQQWEHVTLAPLPLVPGTGRMTGGGSIFTSAKVRVTHGFELHCNIQQGPNNLEINWDGGNNFHLDALTRVFCFDDPSIAPQPPNAGFDTLEGAGTGTLNGKPATITFTLTDAGEPGTKDIARYEITQNSVVVLSVGPATLDKGNQQAHK